jgi:DNA-binding Lrp family transcriptional regulator
MAERKPPTPRKPTTAEVEKEQRAAEARMLLPSVEEAKRRSEKNRSAHESKETKLAKAKAEKAQAEAEKVVLDHLAKIAERVEEAIAAGLRNAVVTLPQSDVPGAESIIRQRIREILEGERYVVEIVSERADYGDSAAPAMVDETKVAVSW